MRGVRLGALILLPAWLGLSLAWSAQLSGSPLPAAGRGAGGEGTL